MVDVVLLQTVSILVTSVGLLLAALYYVLQIRHQTKIRKTDLLLRLYLDVKSKEWLDAASKLSSLRVKDYEDYVKQYGSILSGNPMQFALMEVCGMYDLIGTLLFRKLIDPVSVFDIVGIGFAERLHESLKPIIEGIRREINEPGVYCGFDYLIDELTRREPHIRKAWGGYASQSSLSSLDKTGKWRNENKEA
jgi:hypothetical protein